jgi:hypothetical protein
MARLIAYSSRRIVKHCSASRFVHKNSTTKPITMPLELSAPLGKTGHQLLTIADPEGTLVSCLVVALVFLVLAAWVAKANLLHLPINPLRWHYWVVYEANELGDVRVRVVLILCVISICASLAAAYLFLALMLAG